MPAEAPPTPRRRARAPLPILDALNAPGEAAELGRRAWRAANERGRLAEALGLLDRALALGPPPDVELAVLSVRGDVVATMGSDDGWNPPFPAERYWRGQDLRGRTLLLTHFPVLGYGDVLQLARYVPRAAALGARVVLSTFRRACRLLSSCEGVAAAVPRNGPAPAFDFWAAVRALGAAGAPGVPRPSPAYLRPEPALAERFRRELSGPGLRVGFAHHGRLEPLMWRGDDYAGLEWMQGVDRRALPLAGFARLAALPGVRLYSLLHRRNDGYHQLAGARFPFTDLGGALDDGPDSFVETAAALSCMDLFVTSDQVLAHLAGALGVPTLVVQALYDDGRYGEGEQSALYRSARMVRLREHDWDWGAVFDRLVDEVRAAVPRATETTS